jgi:hypothetical protein
MLDTRKYGSICTGKNNLILVDQSRSSFNAAFLSCHDFDIAFCRHSLADVFLDNNNYNGGTTGLDAYWADVPIVSSPLEKFSARCAHGQFHEIGSRGVLMCPSFRSGTVRASTRE